MISHFKSSGVFFYEHVMIAFFVENGDQIIHTYEYLECKEQQRAQDTATIEKFRKKNNSEVIQKKNGHNTPAGVCLEQLPHTNST